MKGEPPDHAWTILQDHGPSDGGWGPAAVALPGLPTQPFIYTGEAPQVLEALHEIVRVLAQQTGKPTILARYAQREDVLVVGGSS